MKPEEKAIIVKFKGMISLLDITTISRENGAASCTAGYRIKDNTYNMFRYTAQRTDSGKVLVTAYGL